MGTSKRSTDPAAAQVKAPEAPKVVRVEVQPAVKHTFSGRLPITGELKPIQEVTLKSRVAGNVVVLKFDEGDQVKKGDLIAKIEASNQQAQLRSNSAAVEVAEAQLARAQAETAGRVQAMAGLIAERQSDLARSLGERIDGLGQRVGASLSTGGPAPEPQGQQPRRLLTELHVNRCPSLRD